MQAFVISWAGQLGAARNISRNLQGHIDQVTIIHSEPESPVPLRGGTESVDLVDNEWFFGRKFQRALELAKSDPILVIQADARFDDWPTVVEKFRSASAAFPVGVWAPNINHSSWVTSKVAVRDLNREGLVQVSQTDAVVLGLNHHVITELRKLDYSANNLGWGVEWAAIALSLTRGLLVVRDTSLTVGHPRGSGYHHEDAYRQQAIFLSQLDAPEQAVITLLRRSHMLTRPAVRRAVSLSNRWSKLSSLVVRMIPKSLRASLKGTIERMRGVSR